MSWLLADMKKKMNDAKSTIEQSFKQVAESANVFKNEKDVEENEKVVSKPENEKEKLAEDADEVQEKKEETSEESVTSPTESAAETAKKSMAALFGGLKAGSGVASTKLFEYSKVATKKLEEVKNAVIENTMLGDLNKEQDEFEKQLQEEREKLKNIDLPWQGLPDETLAKKQMLSLSTDTRNFLRDSAANSEYTYEQQQAMATLLLKIDPNLANVRFQLVPKQVKENQFWQNYFYRIGLIRQSMQGQGSTGRTTPTQVATSSVVEKEVEEPEVTSQVPEVSEKPAPVLESVNVEKEKEPEPERVGEESQEESGEDEEEKEPVLTTEQPAAPGEATLTSVDEEWEREILADLNDYDDVVEKTGGKDDDAWEAEIQELLNAE